ncbi:TPA: DNA/RNA non-specific endonuclease [Streptococcus agalactiae]|nr:DNA/RNA non-specific endonuclease [Streptococcus agalactiae]
MKKQTNSIFGKIVPILIGFSIAAGAIIYAESNGYNLLSFLGGAKTVFTGNREELTDLSKKTKEAFLNSSNTGSKTSETNNNTEATLSSTTNSSYVPLSYSGNKQMVNGELDELGRANYGHIQLKYADKPKVDRESKISYNPVGWHNYKFYYEDDNGKKKKDWVMDRGHLVGYLFSGINTEPKNLVPMTRFLNAGTYSRKHIDSHNPYSMVFYENSLNRWLKTNPQLTLDYYVVANYKDKELVPRSVSLYWTAFNKNGKQIKVNLGDNGKANYNGLVGTVTLLNTSSNAEINYLDGTAKPTYTK